MYNPDRVCQFRAAYLRALTDAVSSHPEDYAFPVTQAPAVVDRMLSAVARNSCSVGPAMRAAMRNCGIKSPSLKNLQTFLAESM